MGHWTDGDVRAALALAPEAGAEHLAFSGVSTDSRSLEPGALFVALRGERFDAHEFLAAAAERGARAAVVDRLPDGAPAALVYYVAQDTLDALGRLARYRRRALSARICAVTGTNGKTTTKEMARAVLARRFRVHATVANLNNLVGAPLTLLEAPDDVEAVVVELGTNAPGEIARLAAIVEPDAAVITGVSEGHLEGLVSLEGVLREKTSLLLALAPGGAALVGDEPPELAERARQLVDRVQVAGLSERADPDLRAADVLLDETGRVRFRWAGQQVRLAFRGRDNARNALLALGLAREWGVDPAAAVAALAALEPPKLRSEIQRYGDLLVIADCYNANPASVQAAVDLLTSLPRGGGRVAVVGTMLELGAASEALHRRTAERIAAAGLDLIVATGSFTAAFEPLAAALGDRLIRAADPLEAYDLLDRRLNGDEVLLLKASRGVALERLLPLLERDWSTHSAPAAARNGTRIRPPARGAGAGPQAPDGEAAARTTGD